jgi:hypothetical protein
MLLSIGLVVVVLNTTFNNILVISWRSVLARRVYKITFIRYVYKITFIRYVYRITFIRYVYKITFIRYVYKITFIRYVLRTNIFVTNSLTIIMKTKVLLPQAQVTLDGFGYPA